jgi:hypothetical protein
VITGTVVDAEGLVVEGADVTLTNQQTNYAYKSKTSSTGSYQFLSIDYSVYRITVEKQGFRRGVVENIKLEAATAHTVPPIKLDVGGNTESVVLEAGAESVNTTSVELTGTVEKKQIDELPILDRHPLALLELGAGVNNDPSGNLHTVIAGQRSSFSNMTLDGNNIRDNYIRENDLDFSPNYPFSSQTQEFTVTEQNSDDWDISASKDFNLTEKLELTFRTEVFNVLNHPVFAVPTDPNYFNFDMSINSTTFGQSTSTASTPRRLQFSLRLKFWTGTRSDSLLKSGVLS